MDNMAYLNQISADNRRVKTTGSLFSFNPKLIIGLGIAAGLALLIIIFGAIFSSGGKDKQLLYQINIRSTNLIEIISEYNEYLKSSRLKSMGSSLSAVLTNTVSNTNSVITNEYGNAKPPDKITKNEEEYAANIRNELEVERLNGRIDRSFVRQFTLEIALLMSLESECSARTKSSAVDEALTSSYNNLKILHEEFENYSDATT